MFPACFRLPSVGLLPALPAGLGCCFPVLSIVVPLELPSALGPPFTIAVAIFKTGQDWCPDGQPPYWERATADMYFVLYLSTLSRQCLNICKTCESIENDHWGQLKGESEKVGNGCLKGWWNSVSGQKLIRSGHFWRKSRFPLELTLGQASG